MIDKCTCDCMGISAVKNKPVLIQSRCILFLMMWFACYSKVLWTKSSQWQLSQGSMFIWWTHEAHIWQSDLFNWFRYASLYLKCLRVALFYTYWIISTFIGYRPVFIWRPCCSRFSASIEKGKHWVWKAALTLQNHLSIYEGQWEIRIHLRCWYMCWFWLVTLN